LKLFFDTEFTGLRQDTTLISIGIVSENERQFYAELTDYNEKLCDDWIKNNVLEHLYTRYPKNVREAEYVPNLHVGDTTSISKALEIWLKQFDYVEMVSDVCHYDFMLFINLFGTAWSLPKSVCPSCYDINQDIARKYGISQREAFDKSREDILYQNYKERTISGNKHNALYDAKVIREIYQILNGVKFS
jgi:hypothetical protein